MIQHLSRSSEDTFRIGCALGKELPLPSAVYLFGELGAGKTTLVKGILYGVAQVDPAFVQSPTFTYLHVYSGERPVYHFDLYRLRDVDEFLSMGFDEYFDAGAVCCVEWPERIAPYFPAPGWWVHLKHLQEGQRLIMIDTKACL